MLKQRPQQVATVRLQGGVRLQGQGVRNSINSVRDEIGFVYRVAADGKKKHFLFVFWADVTGGTMKVDLSRSSPLHP